MGAGVFLRADWEYLVMLNYEVDPEVLKKYLPPFTEIDFFQDKSLVSVVGFMFNNTKVMGIKWPGHINFEEVNLRFYIKYFDGKKWRRGVAFISEIVPRTMISRLANMLYNEHYSTAKMSHNIEVSESKLKVGYQWKVNNQGWNTMEVIASPLLMDIKKKSEEEFIFEHYYGYNELNKTTTIEYSLEHPVWKVWPVLESSLQCDIEKLYGNDFTPFIKDKLPRSVFLAKGSQVIVRKPVKLFQ